MEPPSKKPRGLWSLQQLEAAMAAVQGGEMSQRAAAARYSIPRRTLVNHLKSGKVEKQIGRRTVLTSEQENDLATRIKRLASIGFPLTPKVIGHQAYVFCEQHKIPNNFNQTKKRAGKDWLKLFLKRHPDISKRKVQILNPGRAQKLNKPIVMQHFTEYKKIYEELEIGQNPQRLYNMDEKGCRLTIHNQPVVLAQKGVKRVHMIAPEHAENITVAACVNALGSPIPPMILFKGKRLKPEFNDNLPAGSLVKMSPKGSMTTSLFVDFIHHFAKYKAAGKCLLVFDGASCHLDYTIVEAADQHDIILYCLPSNTTHELQPLDKSVNKSFEHHWDEEALLFLYQNPDKKLTKARFNSIFSRVWSKCMTLDNIVNGFRATGLYPYNPDEIPDEAYAPSVLTERPQPENNSRAVTDRSTDSEKDDEEENYRSLQKSHTAATSPVKSAASPSDENLWRPVRSPAANSLNSNNTFFDDNNPCSQSLLYQYDLVSPVLTNTGVKPRIVDYSSSDFEFANENLPAAGPSMSDANENLLAAGPSKSATTIRRPIIYSSESDTFVDDSLTPELANENLLAAGPSKSDTTIRRPIIYSSDSDTSVDDSLTPRQKLRPQFIRDIYSSFDDENIDPMISRQEHTPEKQTCVGINNTRQVCDDSSTASDSEDNLPLTRFETKQDEKSPFHKLIPTPNFAVVKDKKPRRKALNYKARIVTRDLFVEKDSKKEMSKKKQPKKTTANKNLHMRENEKEQQSKKKKKKGCVKKSRPVKRNEKNISNKEQNLKKKYKKNKTIKKKVHENSQIDPADKWYCHACNTESFEDMRLCLVCQRWFHEECVGLTKKDVDFKCPMCN